jgi:type II secretory pathway pseudopilin PulG
MQIMSNCLCASNRHGKNAARGFTTLELMIVIAIALIMAAVVVPGYLSMMRYLRIAGDARDLNGLIAQAKMRAAEDFTHARVRADLAAGTFELEVWDTAGNCWRADDHGPAGACTTSAAALRERLSQGVSFGFAGAGAGAPNPQAVISQAPVCGSGVAGGAAGTSYPNSACIEFNSRGRPVAPSGSPTATDALYVTDARSVYGVTVIISGLVQVWTTSATTTAWQAR